MLRTRRVKVKIPKYVPKPERQLDNGIKTKDPLSLIIIMTNFDKAEVEVDGEKYEGYLTKGL